MHWRAIISVLLIGAVGVVQRIKTNLHDAISSNSS